MRRSSDSKRRAAWMAEFEKVVNTLMPESAGRIVWADATHLCNSMYSPADAAERYVRARQVELKKPN